MPPFRNLMYLLQCESNTLDWLSCCLASSFKPVFFKVMRYRAVNQSSDNIIDFDILETFKQQKSLCCTLKKYSEKNRPTVCEI